MPYLCDLTHITTCDFGTNRNAHPINKCLQKPNVLTGTILMSCMLLHKFMHFSPLILQIYCEYIVIFMALLSANLTKMRITWISIVKYEYIFYSNRLFNV